MNLEELLEVVHTLNRANIPADNNAIVKECSKRRLVGDPNIIKIRRTVGALLGRLLSSGKVIKTPDGLWWDNVHAVTASAPNPIPRLSPEPEAHPKPVETYDVGMYLCGDPEDVDLSPRIAARKPGTIHFLIEKEYEDVVRIQVADELSGPKTEFPHQDYTCFAGADVPSEWFDAAIKSGPCYVFITTKGNSGSQKGKRYPIRIPKGFKFAAK